LIWISFLRKRISDQGLEQLLAKIDFRLFFSPAPMCKGIQEKADTTNKHCCAVAYLVKLVKVQ